MRKDEQFRRTSNRNPTRSFAGIPHDVLNTKNYASLSGWDVKLLLDIVAQYTGCNNGDFTASWSVMCAKGWRSKGTLSRAVEELLNAGFIEKTRQGGRNLCSLYAISWQPIDECLDKRSKLHKLDVKPTNVASGRWKDEFMPSRIAA